eukprot:6213430-Pleurochrysis_carterae.AAC.7
MSAANSTNETHEEKCGSCIAHSSHFNPSALMLIRPLDSACFTGLTPMQRACRASQMLDIRLPTYFLVGQTILSCCLLTCSSHQVSRGLTSLGGPSCASVLPRPAPSRVVLALSTNLLTPTPLPPSSQHEAVLLAVRGLAGPSTARGSPENFQMIPFIGVYTSARQVARAKERFREGQPQVVAPAHAH